MNLLKEKIELQVEEAELGIKKNLDSYPNILKWILIVCVLAILPSFFITKAISNKIWQKKYKNLLIFAKPSFTDPKELKINQIKIFSYLNDSFLVLAEIKNDNLELSASNVKYAFKFFDKNSKEIIPDSGQITGTAFFLPNKSKYLITPRIFSKEKIISAQIVFEDKIQWQKKLSYPIVPLVVTMPKFSQQSDPVAFSAQGFVENKSAYILKEVRTVFLVFDSFKNLLTVSERKDYDIRPKERRGYQQLWPNIYLPNASYIQAITETDILDPKNLILEEQIFGPASDLSRPVMEK